MSYLSYSSKRLLHVKEFSLSRLENLNEIRNSDQKIINDVKDRLLVVQEEFRALASNKFDNKRAILAESIEEMGRNVIRPMSHEFARRRKRKNFNFNSLAKEAIKINSNTMTQSLPWVLVMFGAFQGAFVLNHATLAGAIVQIVSDSIVLFIILKLMIKFFASTALNPTINFVLSLAFLLILPGFQMPVINYVGNDSSWGKFYSTYLLLVIIFYICQFSNTHNLFEENAIESANQKYMEDFDLVLRDSSESINDDIVRFLHGTLQTKLAASVLRFRNVEDDSFDLEREVNNVLTHFEIESELSSFIMSDSLPKRLSLVVEEWEPLIEVDLVPLELDVKSISRSQSSNICDFINECLSNALRHGQATKANVEIAEAVTDILVIVSNNGELLGAVESGLGSKIFTQLSNSRWDIKNKIDGTGVRVSALFSR